MDILHLIDQLEAAINNGWHIPLTSDVIVNEEELLRIVDEMRSRIPQEVQQAKRLLQEKDRVLAQAREERDRIVALAGEEAARLTEESEITKAATVRAQTILERAKRDADNIRKGADDYVVEVLGNLQRELEQLLRTVNNGIVAIQQGVTRSNDETENPSDAQRG
ncbi:MAG: ATPase [Chloroflexi bacterium]|nr:ATPase [Chloroflexota bacterium]